MITDNSIFNTLKEIIQETFGSSSTKEISPWVIGKQYFIRTVTMHLTGKLILLTEKELVLTEAAWIADSGRFHDALKNGELNEVEPFIDDVIINRDSIVDATKWNHQLPRNQK